ncbi:T9SS type A sorting domain-containing protein [Arachidicoccus terrestris]|uniref:T9SS type A sorting domain-containing protein n=1 Tax=Arachidicoccus terrestris TaxID=2875539 RepID=UPI001CC55B89|nr:T9SS type A sorting domain-containing protein [Arachidicoccus terrestris]UAY54890.1 T9SS type A sorting domain-containing protein [Arachidicoccus terrestris]
MKSILRNALLKSFIAGGLSIASLCAIGQSGPVKVDFNMSGRQLAEVNEDGYTPWAVTNGGPDTLVANGVTFIVSKGVRGDFLAMTWYKAGVQSPNFARFSEDGLFVKDGDFDKGSEIQMKIIGLTAGHHSLITYHNITDNISADQACPIDIHLNGEEVISNLVPTVRALKITDCQKALLSLNVAEGQDVVIRFIADTIGNQTIKNLIINGFQLDGISASDKSNTPLPADRNEHVETMDGDNVQLTWSPAVSAASHDIYFGTDSLAVAQADHNSPLYKGNQALADTTYAVSNLYSREKYFWRVDEVSADQTYKGDVWYFKTRQLAFKGAEGYGRFAIGGRGGKVVEVTNLNDGGPGSLREAVINDIGPRTIVFAVSGLIQLKSRLVLNQPHVTVAGQTAPGKGITIRSAPFGITGNDCIVRFVRVRLGGGTTYDGMGLTGADNSIMDHCSISWTIDEAFSSRGAHNITLQRTLISEALNAAGHQNYPPGTEHGYAATIGGDIGSFHHNLLADCYGRNWSLGGGLTGDGYYSGRMDISNNVVYNWGHRATDGGAKEVNFVNNYYKPGAGTDFFYAFNAQHEGVGLGMQRCFFNGNVMPGHFDESNQTAGRKASYSNGDTSSYETFVNEPFFPNYIGLQTAENAYKDVLSDVGCYIPTLDDHDIRIIKETLNGTYSVVGSVTGKKGFPDNEADAGGFEDYPEIHRPDNWDSDHDGLPDWWESINGLNPNSAPGDFSDSNADDDRDGFTNLEDYLGWMATPHASGPKNRSIRVNLKALARGYGLGPTFTVTGTTNGTVIINQDSIAVFTPARGHNANGSGYETGSFTFKVQDAMGSVMEREVNLVTGVNLASSTGISDFTAIRLNQKNVKLNWITQSEQSNKYFQVQKSVSFSGPFKDAGPMILSKAENGTSTTPLRYNVVDANNATSSTFYRILQTAQNGKQTYSDVQMVLGAGTNTSADIKIWPVPSPGQVNIDLKRINVKTRICVYDLRGLLVLDQIAQPASQKGIVLKTKGIYLIKVLSAEDSQPLYQGKIIIK